MKKLIWLFSTITMLHLICLSGCSRIPQKQLNWDNDLANVKIITSSLSEKKEPLLLTNQITALVGKPDYIVTPVEYKELMVAEHSYKERVLSMICEEYCRARRGLPQYDCSDFCRNGMWKNNKDFNDCVLWLYDESIHFDKPISDYYCRHVQPGFICWVLIVKDSKVMAILPISGGNPVRGN
jgi:hypothetical protein